MDEQETFVENKCEAQEPASSFVPTLHELEILGQYWLNTLLEGSRSLLLHQHVVPCGTKLRALAERRTASIRAALGEDRYDRFMADMNAQPLSRQPSLKDQTRSEDGERADDPPRDLVFPDDCDGLGYCFDASVNNWIGYIDGVNGGSGPLSEGFSPITVELEVIMEYWLFTHFAAAYASHRLQQTGSTDWRLICYSDRRLQKLRRVLRDERYLAISVALDRHFEARFGSFEWLVFRYPGR